MVENLALNSEVSGDQRSIELVSGGDTAPRSRALEYPRGVGPRALGISYSEGAWDSDRLDQVMYDLFVSRDERTQRRSWMATMRYVLGNVLIDQQRGSRAFSIARNHYDKGNDLFRAMLDSSMSYTCGYWAEAKNLDQAQAAKLDRICKKLNLQRGMRLLDIGCGWGNLLKFAAENYGVIATGLTVSKEQAKLAKERCHGLSVEVLLQDYRTFSGKFDCVASIEMIEAVGKRNIPVFFNMVKRCLNDGGDFVLQVISAELFSRRSNPLADEFGLWLERNIFPAGYLPNLQELVAPCATGELNIVSWEDISSSYDQTLMAWADNFNRAWPTLKDAYGERFKRVWNFYLYSCAAIFRARLFSVGQIHYRSGTLAAVSGKN
jgi:cyclopropane-fatty-acyl-phospholipid synthase